jgi:putative tricarboxylic transport membrane protein
MVLTVLLTPIMEQALRQSLVISHGDFSIFMTRPISAGLLLVAVLFLLGSAFQLTTGLRSDPDEL